MRHITRFVLGFCLWGTAPCHTQHTAQAQLVRGHPSADTPARTTKQLIQRCSCLRQDSSASPLSSHSGDMLRSGTFPAHVTTQQDVRSLRRRHDVGAALPIVQRYANGVPDFAWSCGLDMQCMPKGRRATLVYFTALTCPVCATFHTSEIDTFIQAVRQNKRLRIVVRDYPIDGISLRASAFLWSPSLTMDQRKDLWQHMIRDQAQWIQCPDKASSLMEQRVCTYARHAGCDTTGLVATATDTSDTSRMKAIFDARRTDQALFDMSDIPYGVVLMSESNGTYTWCAIPSSNVQRIVHDVVAWLNGACNGPLNTHVSA
jgi:hypothetical protein